MAITSNIVNIPSNSYLSAGSTYTWSTPTTNFNSSSGTPLMSIPANGNSVVLEKSATLEINGNVVINGMDLDERLKTIEKVLCIPQRDVTMESKYPKLKKLYDDYMRELDKYNTWERVKGEDK